MTVGSFTAPMRLDLAICATCGTEYNNPEPPAACDICDDPRQFVPRSGQSWTSHNEVQKHHKNKFSRIDETSDILWQIWTEPKFAIGQRAILIKTAHGNVLWDCLTLLDEATVDFINSHGGLSAIVISHPHYYTSHLNWGHIFNCPVHIAGEDTKWLRREDHASMRKLVGEDVKEIVPGIRAIKVGGHFPGSLVLHWDTHLFIADSFVIVPSGLYQRQRAPGTTSFSFMWSIPNMIPLGPDAIQRMWCALEPFDFRATHGAFAGLDVYDEDGDEPVKIRVIKSMNIQIAAMGWSDHHLVMSSDNNKPS